MKKITSVLLAILMVASLSVTAFAYEPQDSYSCSVNCDNIFVSKDTVSINPLPEEFLTGEYEVYLSDPIPFAFQNQDSTNDAEPRSLFPGVGQFAIVRRFPNNLDCLVYFTWRGEMIGNVATSGLEIYPGSILDNTLIDYIPATMKNTGGATEIWVLIDHAYIPTTYRTVVVIGDMRVYVLSTASWAVQTFPSFRVTIKDFD